MIIKKLQQIVEPCRNLYNVCEQINKGLKSKTIYKGVDVC